MSTNVYLKSKIEERTSQAAVIENLQKTAADAKRDLTDDERKTFDSIVERLAFLDGEIKRLTDAEAGAAQFVEIYGAHAEAEATRRRGPGPRTATAPPPAPPEERANRGARGLSSLSSSRRTAGTGRASRTRSRASSSRSGPTSTRRSGRRRNTGQARGIPRCGCRCSTWLASCRPRWDQSSITTGSPKPVWRPRSPRARSSPRRRSRA